MLSSFAYSSSRGAGGGASARDAADQVLDRRIGDLLREACKLTDSQISWILSYHREEGMRFGEAAIELGLARSEDVLWALSQQFHYPYALDEKNFNPELVVAANPFGEESEAFRELRSQLLMSVLAPDQQPRRALAVVSPDIGDGKTYLASNMAVALSQLGGPTLLIDADMRTPRQQEVFGFEQPRIGLSAMLTGRTDDHIIQRSPALPTLYVLPVGAIPPNPLELIQRPAFGLLMQEMTAKFDYVVVDTPAAVHGADSRVIAAACGAVMVIGRRGRSRMKAMNTLLAGLAKTHAKLAGVVMNER
jgi:chain length determinant protein tyrosine kinase EpsG